jgi:hypothetical protein
MKVTINRAENAQSWADMVSENLKSGNSVALENFDYSTDLDKCYLLARQFSAKMFVDAQNTICHFLTSN